MKFAENGSPLKKMASILKEKSYKFSLRIIKLFQHLSNEQREFIISRQIVRSGTSIGANIEEAFQGESKADFIHKLAIANNKEAFGKILLVATFTRQ